VGDINTLIIDASCIAYFLEGCLERFDLLDSQDTRKALILFIQERLFLNTGFHIAPVWCLDSKPYWRSRFEPEYKANRMGHKLDISPTLNLLEELGCHTVSHPECEADDIAAALVRMFPDCHHYLLTTDNDWSGMVGERVTMLSPLFEPRVRQPVHVWGWLRGKFAKLPKCQQAKWQFPEVVGFNPQAVWEFKALFGDSGDNLPPGCHPGLIDLFNPIIDPLEDETFTPNEFLLALDCAVNFDERRSQQFARSLPDLPFNPIRIGAQ
jgi:5'-3' exonuclease